MIEFNELAFSDDMQSLTIDCSVNLEEQPHAYIKRVYLEYYKNRNTTNAPSDKAYLVFNGDSLVPPVTEVREHVDVDDLSMEKNGVKTFRKGLFYVLVHWCDGEEDAEEYYDVAAILDWQYVYDLGMHYISKFALGCGRRDCDVPEDFEQIVLVVHALELALEAKDLDMLDLLWGRAILFSSSPFVSPCNCR